MHEVIPMRHSSSRHLRELFGVDWPHAFPPPAMLELTLATWAMAFGLVFVSWFHWAPNPDFYRSLVTPAAGGVSLLGWLTIVNVGWGLAIVVDAAAMLLARKSSRIARIRAGVLALLGLGIVAAVQIAIEGFRILGAPDP
jgi:hypothetical protein